MARENNIDLSQVRGTGAGGRITKQDLEAYLTGTPPARARTRASAATAGARGRPAALRRLLRLPRLPAPAPAPVPSAVSATSREPQRLRVEPMSVMRQKIAEHMVFSKHTSAHVTTVHKVDMTKVAKLRDS